MVIDADPVINETGSLKKSSIGVLSFIFLHSQTAQFAMVDVITSVKTRKMDHCVVAYVGTTSVARHV